jgi:hypothetical protein
MMPGFYVSRIDGDQTRPAGPLRLDASHFVCACGVVVVLGEAPLSTDIREQSDKLQCTACWRAKTKAAQS